MQSLLKVALCLLLAVTLVFAQTAPAALDGGNTEGIEKGGVSIKVCAKCIDECQAVGNPLEYCEIQRCASFCRAT